MQVDATSLFDAVEKATAQVSRLWWYDPRRIVEVHSGEQRWWVDPEKLRRRRLTESAMIRAIAIQVCGNSCFSLRCISSSCCSEPAFTVRSASFSNW